MTGEAGGIRQQRSQTPHPPVDADVIDLHASPEQQLLNVAVDRLKRRYQHTATTITSGGNR